MKKLLTVLLILIVFYPTVSFAGPPPPVPLGGDPGGISIPVQQFNPGFLNMFNNQFIPFLSGLLIIAGTIGIIINGFYLIFSGGDTGKVSTARNWIIYSLAGVFIGSSALIIVTWAQQGFTGQGGTSIQTALNNIGNWLSLLLIAAGTIGIIISGYTFISSGGDTGKVASARNWIIYSLIGVLIGSSAYVLSEWANAGTGIAFSTNIFYSSIWRIVRWMSEILLLAGIIGIIVSGYTFISSGGDSGKVASAKNWIIYSLIGVFVGWFAEQFADWASGGFVGGIGLSALNSLATIANWLFSFLLVAGVIGIVISGYLFVNSSGDSGKVSTARNLLIYSLVGVFVASIARVLVSWAQGGF